MMLITCIREEHNYSKEYHPVLMDHPYHIPFSKCSDLYQVGIIGIEKYDETSKIWIDLDPWKADDTAAVQERRGGNAGVQANREAETFIRPYLCHTCGEDFRYINEYIKHQIVHKRPEEQRLKLAAKKPEEQRIKLAALQLDVPCTCKTCEIPKRPYVCEICGEDFRYKFRYNKHILWHKRGEEQRVRILACVCRTCGKKCKTLSQLEIHETVHTGEKPHLCHICGKGYKTRNQCMQHIKTHSGTRSICKTPSNLLRFEKLCEICGKCFRHPASYYQHRAAHTSVKQHVCEICGEKFSSVIHMRKHRNRVHVKKFKNHCHICYKSFEEKERLEIHINVHMKIRPYQCYYCDSAFRSAKQTRRHLKMKHGKEKPLFTHLNNLHEKT